MYRIPLIIIGVLFVLFTYAIHRDSYNGLGSSSLPIRSFSEKYTETPSCLSPTSAQVNGNTLKIPIPQESTFPIEVSIEGATLSSSKINERTSYYETKIITMESTLPSEVTLISDTCQSRIPVVQKNNHDFESFIERIRSLGSSVTYKEFMSELSPSFIQISQNYPVTHQDRCHTKEVKIQNPTQRGFSVNATLLYKKVHRINSFPVEIKNNTEPLTLIFCDGMNIKVSPESQVVLYGTKVKHRVYLRKGTIELQVPSEILIPQNFLRTPDMEIIDILGHLSITHHDIHSKTSLRQHEGYTEYKEGKEVARLQSSAYKQSLENQIRQLKQKGIIPKELEHAHDSLLMTTVSVSQLLYHLLEQQSPPHESYATLYTQKKELLPRISQERDLLNANDFLYLTEKLNSLTK